MKFAQVLTRITGLEVGPLGASWEPPEAEVDIVQRVVTFLEDRRVLYNDLQLEVPEHCLESVRMIREFLTQELGKLPNRPGFTQNLRVIRAACRKFMDKVGTEFGNDRPNMFGGRDSWIFAAALGELRSTIGTHVAILCAKHGLGVEGDLATCLPPALDDTDT